MDIIAINKHADECRKAIEKAVDTFTDTTGLDPTINIIRRTVRTSEGYTPRYTAEIKIYVPAKDYTV